MVGEGIVSAVRQQTVAMSSERSLRLTACVGIALFGQEFDVAHEAVLVNADIAMYEAKEAGRDRSVVYRHAGAPAEEEAESAAIERTSPRLASLVSLAEAVDRRKGSPGKGTPITDSLELAPPSVSDRFVM